MLRIRTRAAIPWVWPLTAPTSGGKVPWLTPSLDCSLVTLFLGAEQWQQHRQQILVVGRKTRNSAGWSHFSSCNFAR
jgi:hypothetical protein